MGTGCFSIWTISKYADDSTLIYTEWLSSTKASLRKGIYPYWLNGLRWPASFAEDCCAWHGPLDIGDPRVMNVSDLRIPHQKITMEIMRKVEKSEVL
jgi:hypothetical protein